jgi:hypothetical protein
MSQTMRVVGTWEERLNVVEFCDMVCNGTRSPSPKHAKKHPYHQDKTWDKFIESYYINDAIAAIRRGEFSNYANVAREYKCNRGALFRRIRSLAKSKKNTNSYSY